MFIVISKLICVVWKKNLKYLKEVDLKVYNRRDMIWNVIDSDRIVVNWFNNELGVIRRIEVLFLCLL